MKEAFRQFLKQKRHHFFWASYGLLVLVVAILGLVGGLLFGYAIDLPEVEQLEQLFANSSNRSAIISFGLLMAFWYWS